MRDRSCSRLLVIVATATACASVPARSAPVQLDSLSVERGACYGTCDIYQLMVRRNGDLTLRKQSMEARLTYTSNDARRLLTSATDAGLLTLPARIRADSSLCPLEASDHSTVILTAYAPSRSSRVEHYTGCYLSHDLRVAPALERLVIFERQLEALVAGKY